MHKKILALLLSLAALLALFSSSVFVVPEQQYALIYQSGVLQRVVQTSGVHVKQPWPLQEVRFLNRNVLAGAGNTDKTPIVLADGKQVPAAWLVQWKVTDPQVYLNTVGVSVDKGNEALSTATAKLLQSLLGSLDWQQVQAMPRDDIHAELQKRLNNIAADAQKPWGIEVLSVRLTRIDINQEAATTVQAQMRQTIAQQISQMQEEAAHAAAEVHQTAAQEREELLAQAQSQAQQTRAKGDAQAIRLYAQSHAQNPQFARFYYALAAYRDGFKQGDNVMVINYANNTLFKDMQNVSIPRQAETPLLPPQAAASAPSAESSASALGASVAASAVSSAAAVVPSTATK